MPHECLARMFDRGFSCPSNPVLVPKLNPTAGIGL
jgi:hypothetical protein